MPYVNREEFIARAEDALARRDAGAASHEKETERLSKELAKLGKTKKTTHERIAKRVLRSPRATVTHSVFQGDPFEITVRAPLTKAEKTALEALRKQEGALKARYEEEVLLFVRDDRWFFGGGQTGISPAELRLYIEDLRRKDTKGVDVAVKWVRGLSELERELDTREAANAKK